MGIFTVVLCDKEDRAARKRRKRKRSMILFNFNQRRIWYYPVIERDRCVLDILGRYSLGSLQVGRREDEDKEAWEALTLFVVILELGSLELPILERGC